MRHPRQVAPLVITLALDDASQERLEELRRRHFPPERNVVPAHVSLFHAVPEDDDALDVVRTACRRSPFDVAVTGVRSLGRGTALTVAAAELDALHADLRRQWLDVLTAQDRQPFRPHVTVQNKVAPDAARALQAQLSAAFTPWSARAVGVDVWRYAGGPWEPVAQVPFEALPAG